jgi:Ca-activated chloride channel family protein
MALPFVYRKGLDSTTFGRRRFAEALLVTILGAVVAGWPAAPGQFSSGVNLVEVYAAVLDQNGTPVTGLTRDDFTVLEDGQAQRLSAFAEGDFPLSVALAIDRSFSMAKQLPTEVSAARTFLGELRPQDQSMIVAIGSEIEILAPLSADRQAQFRALTTLTAWGTTGLHDAIIQSIDAIQMAKGRRALVLLSDGNDRYSKATAGEALDRARRSDVMVYPIATGRTRPALFAELASLTGGRSFQPRDPGELNTIVRGIANELRHQYLLGYTPSRPIVAGEEQWRSITVRVKRPDVTVRARDGYLAK